jgi:CheY-like chemotaxis protein
MAQLGELSIMIVDDHEGMRALLRKVLERGGAVAVRDAPNGAEALRMLSDASAQLILVDRNMPQMDGPQFIRHVRSDPRLTSARIVMISGQTDDQSVRAALDAGADAVLAKPIAPRDLLAALNRLLAD